MSNTVNLPAYRVHRSDGASYVTSMSPNSTLKDAEDYFLNQRFVDEDADGNEMSWKAVRVEKVR